VGLHVKCLLLLCVFNKKIIFSTDFQKVQNVMEICRVEAELFHADGQTDMQTDMTKLIGDYLDLGGTR